MLKYGSVVAAVVVVAVVGVVHLAFPKVETRTVTETVAGETRVAPLPANPTLAQVEWVLQKQKTIMVFPHPGGIPLECSMFDNTDDPKNVDGVVWQVIYCK